MFTARGVTMLSLIGVLFMTLPGRARQDSETFQDRAVKIGGAEYHFRVFTPKRWSRKGKTPVILFLHGAGERGDDNLAQTRVGIGPAIVRQRDSFPFVVVLPQCPTGRWWSEPAMQAQALKALDQTMTEFNGDPKRTYLTGLSMGGYGSWAIAANNHGRFAALAIVCGGVVPPRGLSLPKDATALSAAADPYGAAAARVGKTPVWIFHGNADPAVPVSESRKMVDALKAIGGNVRYNEYEGVGHNAWDKAYAEAEIFPWMLAQKLKASRR